MEIKESVKVLQECVELQLKKSQDYQNPNSNVKQAMHYRRGVDTIHDIMHGKMLRAQSLLEAASSNSSPNYESLEDTYKDLINYASFAVSFIRGKMEGQDPDCNMFNKKEVVTYSNNEVITTTANNKYSVLGKASALKWKADHLSSNCLYYSKFGYFDQ